MATRTGQRHNPQISTMKMSDIPFAISMTDHEGWGFFPKDFETRIRLYPSGSFVARMGSKLAGIISSVQYGQYAFLGNLIVSSRYRERGVGSALMQHAIDYLLDRGVKSIELDGVLAACSMYRRLGFKDKHLSLRFNRPPQGVTTMQKVIPVSPSSIVALDRKLTGIARQQLLRAALADDCNALYVHGNPVSAYALVRERAGGFCMVAPLVATSWRQVPPLVDQVLQCDGDRSLWFGVPEPQYRMSQLLTANGFEYMEPSLRMYFGRLLDYEKHIYGIFGPAVG